MTGISDIGDHTGYWLRIVSNAVSQDFASKVAGEGVTVAEWAFLRVLYGMGSTAPSALAQRMGMTRGAISKLADRLIAKGLVLRIDNPDDRRAHSLSLTALGQAKVPVLARLADANDAAYFGMLTAEEHQSLDRILRALVERRGLTGMPVD